MASLNSILAKMAAAGSNPPNPNCLDEECVLQWVIHETQVIQATYDEATDLELQPEELEEVEDLYAHRLTEVLNSGLRMLGAMEP